MRFLLDTHTLIWSQDDPGKLSAPATAALSDPAHERLLSFTVWEIGLEVALGKLSLSKHFRAWVQTAITDLVLTELPITLDHIERQMGLPFHHRDPFDRLVGLTSLIPARGGAVRPAPRWRVGLTAASSQRRRRR